MTGWKKLPALKTPNPDLRLEEIVIGVGFGSAGYSRDGEVLWQEGSDPEQELPSLADVEALAAADPDHDWRVFFYAPLYEAVYQRQGERLWVSVKRGRGFA